MSYVLTLALDETSQAHFEALRQQWFPPERNLIPAHLTLFHTLPEEQWITDALHAAATAQTLITLTTPQPRSIGRGVAFFFNSSEAVAAVIGFFLKSSWVGECRSLFDRLRAGFRLRSG